MCDWEGARQRRARTYWRELFYAVYDGLSWFNTEKEWLNARTVNMITAGLYKICTQILIRSINKASAVSDKLGHSCKSGPSWCWIHPEEEYTQLLLRREGRITREKQRWVDQSADSEQSEGCRQISLILVSDKPPAHFPAIAFHLFYFPAVQMQHGSSYKN